MEASKSGWKKTMSFKEQVTITRRISSFTRPYRKQFLIAVLWTLVLTVFNILIPRVLQVYMDDYLIKGNITLTISIYFAFAYLLGTFGKMLAQYYGRYFFSLASEQTVENIRNHLFEKINQLGMRFFDQTPAGSLVSRITNDTETIKQFWNVFLALMESSFGMVSVSIAMFVLNAKATGVFLLLSPVMVWAIWYYQKYSSKVYRAMRESLSQLNTKLNESISGMSIIQQFRQEKRVQDEFNRINDSYNRNQIRMVKMNALLLMPLINLLQGIALVIVLYMFGLQSLVGPIEVGVVYAFTSYIQNFFRPMGMLMDNLSVLQDGVVSSSRVLDLLDNMEMAPKQDALQPLEIKNGRIEFKHVSFSYDGQNDVLKDISFTVEPGQTIALVGHTGSGKSSIINVFMRFYEFERGDILIDGHSIKEYPIEEIRKNIGLVLQDSFLFYGDIVRNIRLMDEDLTDNDVRHAAEFVHADQFIEALDNGYHSKVIERGASYSSGERQLLSFARTIIREPKILVLDEATASIDTQTEEFIQDSLRNMRKDRTTIAIAHRLSTIHDANQILVLDKGRIIERGTHDELIALQGTYYDMYRLQSMEAREK